jgi:hypothetical protein
MRRRDRRLSVVGAAYFIWWSRAALGGLPTPLRLHCCNRETNGQGPVSKLGPAPVYRPMHGEGRNGRPATPHNAWRIDWFLGSLFKNRGDVVEAELSLAEYSVFTAIVLR